MEVSLLQTSLGLCCLGVVSHLCYFIRGEHLISAPRVFLIALLSPLCLSILLHQYLQLSWYDSIRHTSIAYGSYVASIFASILFYRAFLHPLRHFPGPFWARLTQWNHVYHIWTNNDNFRYLDGLHRQYGEYVRVGPRLLSVADPDLVEVVHGIGTDFHKSEWYDISQPMTTLHQMRDKALHDRRRRHGWDKAFTTKSLRSYDSRILGYTDTLVRQIHGRSGEILNVTRWCNYFAYDVMGDLAFGRAFDALKKGESHFYIDMMHKSGEIPGSMGTLPWAIQTLRLIPGKINPFMKMIHYSRECVKERKTREPEEPDVMSHLLSAGPFFEEPKREELLLVGDARLLIVAGSDTTATTLTYGFYHLAQDPSLVKRLRAELEEHHIVNDESFNVTGLLHLTFLNAFIQETLRMHPPVPGGVFRDTPPNGMTVGGKFLPPGVKIVGPMYTIHRSPRAFASPNEFIPERWTTRPDLVLNKNAWFPFSVGRFSCIGKQLALNELRTVFAKMMLEFDIKLAEGEDGQTLLHKSKDVFTMSNARLDVVFTAREKF